MKRLEVRHYVSQHRFEDLPSTKRCCAAKRNVQYGVLLTAYVYHTLSVSTTRTCLWINYMGINSFTTRATHGMIMVMKSVEQSLIDFLKSNPNRFASAELQRMPFKNRNGTLASPKAISRRLQENAEEGGMLEVSYDDHNNAFYQIKEAHKKPPILIIDESASPIKMPDGRYRPVFRLQTV